MDFTPFTHSQILSCLKNICNSCITSNWVQNQIHQQPSPPRHHTHKHKHRTQNLCIIFSGWKPQSHLLIPLFPHINLSKNSWILLCQSNLDLPLAFHSHTTTPIWDLTLSAALSLTGNLPRVKRQSQEMNPETIWPQNSSSHSLSYIASLE